MTHSGGTTRRARILRSTTGTGLALLLAALPGQSAIAVAGTQPSPASAAQPAAAPANAALRTVTRAAPVRTAPEDFTEGLRVESASTYTVDLASSSVLVEFTATLTNQTRDVVSGGEVVQTYFPEFPVPVLAGATEIVAQRADGRTLGVDVEVGDVFADVAMVDLEPNLFYGGTQEIRLTYRLPTQPLRQGGISQVNAAYATFPLFGFGDPGLTTVAVHVPEGLQVDFPGAEMTPSGADGWVHFTAAAIEDPANWSPTAIVRDGDAPEEPGDVGALPLNAWADVDLSAPQAEEQEAYGYNASWWIAHQLVEEIGADGLGEVVQAAVDRESPYPSATTTRIPDVADWRTFVDLAQDVGGSELVEALVRDLVLTEEELPLLEQRVEARAEYAELLEAGDGWVPPAELRDAMLTWEFEEAMTLAPRVEKLMERRADVADALDGAGLELSGKVQQQFEEADDLGALDKRWDDIEAATGVLVDAAGADPVTRLGLLVTGAQSDLGAAREALTAADTLEAADAAEAAAGAMPRAGLIGGAVLLGIVVLVSGVAALVVRRRRKAAVPPAASDGVA